MINHILLATNGSDKSRKAEDYALYLAKLSNAELTVIYVFDNRLIHYGQVDQLVTEKTKEQFISYVNEKNDSESSQILSLFSQKAEKEDVFYSTSIRSGDPVKEIVAAATEKSVDLLIVGGLNRAVRGIMPSSGTVGKVLKKSVCPVLVAT